MLAEKYVDRVVICDDGSTDMTAKIAEKMGADMWLFSAATLQSGLSNYANG